MILQIDDWQFQIFEVTQRKYYARERAEHCTCAWCRNYYMAVDMQYPNLRPLMERFSVQIDAPCEMLAFHPTLCNAYFAVSGKILKRGEAPIMVDGLTVEPMERDESMVNFQEDWPVFFLYVSCMTLPWVLEESMNEADSPAKGQKFIQRLLSRWITE